MPREFEGMSAANGCTRSLGGMEAPGALVVYFIFLLLVSKETKKVACLIFLLCEKCSDFQLVINSYRCKKTR